jgi:predicted acyl esterase
VPTDPYRASRRIATLSPEPLKAIVTVRSTDEPYDNDLHYMRGSALAVETHAPAVTALPDVARPPDPTHVGQVMWRDMRVKRLETAESFIHTWLSHPARDAYWRHAGVHADGGHEGIPAAVLAAGGRHDPYRDTVPRLVENLPADRVRGPIAPWCHQHPDRDLPPGPATGFLQETPRWWDRRRRPPGTSVPGRDPGMSHRSGLGVINNPDPGSLADPGRA